ncbi:hypothetical protein RIR_jg14846.t1 [Rhizophagus irregularis DAOM 181602=DAOM 197198]|nr:hypothetical protein RIR_jg14846.t1 [Rhizophagus irregularis DAOM 181602=DAOM 197198]
MERLLPIQLVSSEEWKKPRFFSGLLKNNGKPRFVSFGIFRKSGTKIRLVSRVDSDKQKKPKILLFACLKLDNTIH